MSDVPENLMKSLGHKPRTGKVIECSGCGKSFYRSPSLLLPSKKNVGKYAFCSHECQKGFDYGGRRMLTCNECGSEYRAYASAIKHRGRKFCSMDCNLKWQRKNRKLPRGGSSYKKALWILFSRFIRLRDKCTCISCGKTDQLPEMDAGHYIPKTAGMSIYFDEQNVNCQCRGCNRFRHGNLSAYAIALRQKYGPNILEELDRRRRQTRKISVPEYQQLMRVYSDKLRELTDR